MNPAATPAARPDLDVALSDFAAEHDQGPERALCRLQLLLLDEDTCLARVAYLRTLAAAARGESPPRDLPDALHPFREEFRLLGEEGLFAARAAGRLTPDVVRRLDRLTRDPDALLEAHRQLAADEGAHGSLPAGAPEAAKDETALGAEGTGFTALARAGRVAEVEDRLRPWLPFLLRRAGLADDLDEALARQFLAHVRTRLGEARQRRFRDLLPAWLSDFASQHGLAGRLRPDRLRPSAGDLEAFAVERVLRRAGEDESPWARAFRESALRQQVHDAEALLAFEPAGAGSAPALPNYRRDLFHEARRAHRDGLELFELDLAG
jgi:hypothetical protein